MWHGWGTRAYRVLLGRPEERRTLVTTIGRWEGNITMDFQDMRWTGMEWIDLAQDRVRWRVLANAVRTLGFL